MGISKRKKEDRKVQYGEATEKVGKEEKIKKVEQGEYKKRRSSKLDKRRNIGRK